ncbi:MAG: ABC transporter substrate-binding protein [Acidimicrobiales bacterium]
MSPPRVRALALAVASVLVLAACGGEGTPRSATAPGQSAPTPPGAPEVPPPRPSTKPNAVSIASATAPYPRFGTDAAPGVFPRTIRHAMGETRIERAPLRVVTLDTGELDTAVELGVKPVGTVDYGADGLPAYFKPAEIDGVEVVGTIQAPNLEAIARLRPDVILSSKLRHEALYGQLSQIAPTVFAERVGVTWKQNFDLFAQALGREEQAAATRARYAQRLGEINKALPLPRPSVSVVRVMTGNVRLYQRANFLGVLLTDLGFPRPDSQNVDDFAAEIGLEQLEQAGGDVIVVAVFDKLKNANAEAVLSSPLWRQLPAVQAGRVHTVDDQTWLGGIGYHAAFAVMDQLRDLMGR